MKFYWAFAKISCPLVALTSQSIQLSVYNDVGGRLRHNILVGYII